VRPGRDGRPRSGLIVEFRSVVDAVRCAIEVQNAMVERNSGLAPHKKCIRRAVDAEGEVLDVLV
jgi:class 3 adenylate cyclase